MCSVWCCPHPSTSREVSTSLTLKMLLYIRCFTLLWRRGLALFLKHSGHASSESAGKASFTSCFSHHFHLLTFVFLLLVLTAIYHYWTYFRFFSRGRRSKWKISKYVFKVSNTRLGIPEVSLYGCLSTRDGEFVFPPHLLNSTRDGEFVFPPHLLKLIYIYIYMCADFFLLK